MVVGVHKRAVGVFSHRRDAEEALHELRDSGFAMDRVSVVAQNTDVPNDIAGAEVREKVGDKADEGAKAGAVTGGALGGLTGLLVGLGTLAIPGIGPIMLAGATATALATTLAGVGIGAAAGSLLGGLIGLGIPEERARVYSDRVERGHYLVILDGTEAEIAGAEAIFRKRGVEDFGIYDRPNATPVTPIAHQDFGARKHAVGYFVNRQDAEAAIDDLRTAGFPLSQISLVHKDSSVGEPFVGVNASDRFDGVRLGMQNDHVGFYNQRLNQGEYIIVVDGTDDELTHASSVLSRHGIQHWQIYDSTVIQPTGSAYVDVPLHRNKRAYGVFPHRRDAEAALTDLRNAGFPMENVSLIGKNTDGNGQIAGVGNKLDTGNKADEGAKAGAVTGGALGGLGGLLVGLGALAIPGVGPVLLGGAAATAFATALTGGAIGAAGGLVGALAGLGIPEDRARVYSDRLNRGDYLVMVDGSDADIQRAETILKRRGIEEFAIYDATDLNKGDRQDYDRNVVNDTRTSNYSAAEINRDNPAVIIIDRRDETV
jgi:hypothetical protein